MMEAWLRCWHAIESVSEDLGDWILQQTKPARSYHGRAYRRVNRKQAGWRPRGTGVNWKQARLRPRRTTLAMTVLAMQANATIATERRTQFDTDSETIGIDNRCSGCISHVREDFVGELRPSDRVVKGFAGSKTTNVQVGTLRWSWEDEMGRTHTFTIPNSYLYPTDEFDS